MKEAFWGLGLVMLCLLTFVIIGVISNISLTNQQDYYGVKQTTEAGAYDAVEPVKYKRGVCVCYNSWFEVEGGGAIKFTNKGQYTIEEPDEESNECSNPTTCKLLLGEYVLDPNVFVEGVISRLGSIIKPTEEYDITIQEVIPYPPKVSVNIEFKQALNVDGRDTIHQVIPNKYDGIFEDTGTQSILKYASNTLDDWPMSCDTPKKEETPAEPTPVPVPEDKTTPAPTPSNSTGFCGWHYKNTSTSCASKNNYPKSSGSGQKPSCTGGRTPSVSGCGSQGCNWTCPAETNNKTFSASELSNAAKASSYGSSRSASGAVSSCQSEQSKFCKSKTDSKGDKFTGSISDSCTAYQAYRFSGKKNGVDTSVEKEYASGTTPDSCASLGFDGGICSRKCLG